MNEIRLVDAYSNPKLLHQEFSEITDFISHASFLESKYAFELQLHAEYISASSINLYYRVTNILIEKNRYYYPIVAKIHTTYQDAMLWYTLAEIANALELWGDNTELPL